jgi:hypothetical protein
MTDVEKCVLWLRKDMIILQIRDVYREGKYFSAFEMDKW